MILLDTDVLIWMLRDNEAVQERFKQIVIDTDGAVFITPVQLAEVYAGMRSKERLRTEHFMNTLTVLPIDREAGKHAGEFMFTYAKSHNLTLADAMMAAIAQISACKLWTLNRKHYPMFDGNEFFQ